MHVSKCRPVHYCLCHLIRNLHVLPDIPLETSTLSRAHSRKERHDDSASEYLNKATATPTNDLSVCVSNQTTHLVINPHGTSRITYSFDKRAYAPNTSVVPSLTAITTTPELHPLQFDNTASNDASLTRPATPYKTRSRSTSTLPFSIKSTILL